MTSTPLLRRAGGLVAVLAAVLPAAPLWAELPALAAFEAADVYADRGDWDAALVAAAQGGALVDAVLRWRALREGGRGAFLDYLAFLRDRPDWPGLDRLRANGETAITRGEDPASVVAYFAARAPQTGEGASALAHALIALGREEAAHEALLAAWLELPLTDRGQAALLSDWGDALAPHHWARTQAMLWRWRSAEAARMLPLLGEGQQALARARLALILDEPAAAARLAALPRRLRDDPGLAFDRYGHLVRQGEFGPALALLAPRTGSAAALGEPARWAAGRAQIARWLMREGRHQEAYDIASRHHLAAGENFADLEWLAGYLSLRFLDEPARALGHFAASEAAVQGPISLSRAAYWTGRALDALGRPEEAALAYGRGARHQTAFYGLLSAERLGLDLDPSLAGAEDFGDWRGSPILADEKTQALLLLLAAHEREDARLFALALARSLDRRALGQLARLLEELHEPHLAVLVGKAAVERGIVVPAASFPLHPMANEDWPVAAELALAVARRESEFSPTATSPVGAQGLMQLMPATAREVAADLGLAYWPARLDDWRFNATLGTRYLEMLAEQFGSSAVLIAAGYNAGPGRPRQWLAQRGDFRDGEADVVDWIEHIPFAETRIYVMRVTESIPVYRARLTGRTGPVRFTDLLRGEPPLIRPVARDERRDPGALVAVLSTSDVSPAADRAAAQALALPSLRPPARPAP
jgi:soluble lytic murein transglycosylase